MGHMMEVVRKDYSSFVVGLPNDITCWSYPKKSTMRQDEAAHLAILTAKARHGGGINDIYVFAELEKAALEAPERHAKFIKNRIARLKQKLRKEAES